ncbi:hypothetical protein [Rhodopirellula europaea]|uniref:hypothetical protein n=1 Tax=Rhodopirellula europaea TaxID=1263866 RepID=UPI0030EC8BFE|tara:strand:- start:24 stop:407 length:384 start_codon:yes stop_codon:yes gene_type:complete
MKNLLAMQVCVVATSMAFSTGLSLWCRTVDATEPKIHSDSQFPICEHCTLQFLAELDDPKQFVARTQLLAQMSFYIGAMSFVALIVTSICQLIELGVGTAMEAMSSFTQARIARWRAAKTPKTRQAR